jgi:hypothetical protein
MAILHPEWNIGPSQGISEEVVNACGIWTVTFTYGSIGFMSLIHWQLLALRECLGHFLTRDPFTGTHTVHSQLITTLSQNKSRCCECVPPSQHDVEVGVASAGAGRAPLNSVDLFTVGLEVMDPRVLLHTPDLGKRSALCNHYIIILTYGDHGHLSKILAEVEVLALPLKSCHQSRRLVTFLTGPTW